MFLFKKNIFKLINNENLKQNLSNFENKGTNN